MKTAFAIATAKLGDGNSLHQPENARLIAAAPDLLAALRNIVQAAEADGWNYDQAGDSTVVDSARAAIAKAEGQS